MTLYGLLLQAAGLSHREAAELHGVRLDTVKSWSAGRNAAPIGVIAELRALAAHIVHSAAREIDALGGAPADGEIVSQCPADDDAAKALGLPCVGAWRAMAAIVASGANRLGGRDVPGADLRDVHLTGADLRGVHLTGADLRGAGLRGNRVERLKDEAPKPKRSRKAREELS